MRRKMIRVLMEKGRNLKMKRMIMKKRMKKRI